MAAASLQRMVSRHTRLTCGHGTRLLARSEAMVRSTRADHLHGYLTVAAAHHRGPDGHGRWSRRRSPGLVLDEGFQGVGRRKEGVHDRCCYRNADHGGRVHTDLDTLATALYVKIDDALKEDPRLCRWGPPVGTAPRLTDAELLTLAVMQALLGYTSEARWLRYAHKQLRHLFPYLPGQAGYNKRLRAAVAQVKYFIRALAIDTDYWTDDLWIADSTPVECGRALPITFALTTPKTDEREVLVNLFDVEPMLLTARPGQRIVVDKGYRDAETEAILTGRGVTLLRPTYAGEAPRPGARLFRPLRQLIESVTDTLKGQVDLERHGGRTIDGVSVRILQRLLALTAAIWHNHHTGQPIIRSLIAYDHR